MWGLCHLNPMSQLVSEKKAKLTYLKRELVKRVSTSRYFNKKTCAYTAPWGKMPKRVKELIDEILKLEAELLTKK